MNFRLANARKTGPWTKSPSTCGHNSLPMKRVWFCVSADARFLSLMSKTWIWRIGPGRIDSITFLWLTCRHSNTSPQEMKKFLQTTSFLDLFVSFVLLLRITLSLWRGTSISLSVSISFFRSVAPGDSSMNFVTMQFCLFSLSLSLSSLFSLPLSVYVPVKNLPSLHNLAKMKTNGTFYEFQSSSAVSDIREK